MTIVKRKWLSRRLKCISVISILAIVIVSLKLFFIILFPDYVHHQVEVDNGTNLEETTKSDHHHLKIEVIRILQDCKSLKQDNRTKCHQLSEALQKNAGTSSNDYFYNIDNENDQKGSSAYNEDDEIEEDLLRGQQIISKPVRPQEPNGNISTVNSSKILVDKIYISDSESLPNRKYHLIPLSSEELLVDDSIPNNARLTENANSSFPTIFAITPTHKRLTQKVDLTSLCQTLMNVPQLVWIVVEDANEKSVMVTKLLRHCRIQSVHLNIETPAKLWPKTRGVPQRNAGLYWIRRNCRLLMEEMGVTCNGVVYFMDDDNKYDLRLFEEIRKTKRISVFPVAFAGGLKYEGPVCKNGKVWKWHRVFAKERKFPVDMAAFAVNVQVLLARNSVLLGYNQNGERVSREGFLETRFLERFAPNRQVLECRGSNTEVYVWHVKLEQPSLFNERIHKSDPRMVV